MNIILTTLASGLRRTRSKGPPSFWEIVTICALIGFIIIVILINYIMQRKSPVPINKIEMVPVIKTDRYDPGVVCLAMILEYFFCEKVSLAQLSMDCFCNKFPQVINLADIGTSLADISKVAKDKWLNPKAYKCTSSTLFADAFSDRNYCLPSIIHWDFNYFVVLVGFKYKKVIINHPEQGRISVSLEDFEKSFTGVILKFVEEAIEPPTKTININSATHRKDDKNGK